MPLPKAPAKPATQLKSDDAVLAKAVLPARSLKKGAPEDDATVPMPMAAAQPTVARESPTRYHATTNNDHICRCNTRHTSEQHTTSALCDFQMMRTSLALSGKRVVKRSRFSLLLVATSTCLLTTASRLASVACGGSTRSTTSPPRCR